METSSHGGQFQPFFFTMTSLFSEAEVFIFFYTVFLMIHISLWRPLEERPELDVRMLIGAIPGITLAICKAITPQ